MALNKLKKWIGTQAMTAFFDQLNDNVDATNAAIDDYESLIAGGQEYQAALQNGWTHGGLPLRYSKDDLGYVTVHGLIHAGDIRGGTVIFTLPSGYRPRYFMAVPFYDLESGIGNITDIRISSGGALALVNSPVQLIPTSRISINLFYKGF